MFRANDIMNTDIVTVSPDDTIDQALSLMLQYRITGLVVVDHENYPLGVISDYDLLDMVYDHNAARDLVSHHMTSNVLQVDAAARWTEVADLMRENKIRRLPVTIDGKLVGIITRHDLMRAIRTVRHQAQIMLSRTAAS
jgi:CBS domain-containing protein